MTKIEFENLENKLKQHGYRKYNFRLYTEDYYWAKGFAYYTDENGEECPGYQVIWSCYDMTKYTSTDNNAYEVQITVIVSGRENRTDLSLSGHLNDIEYIEEKAESYYSWYRKEFEDG